MSETNPKIGRVGAMRARREGVAAAITGSGAGDCPYKVNGDYEQRVKARYWMRGWARARIEMVRARRRKGTTTG